MLTGFCDNQTRLVAGVLDRLRYTLWFFECALAPVACVWTNKYQSAVLESDPEKLAVRIAEAETAIQQRNAELLQESPVGSDELEAMARALPVLRMLEEIAQRQRS